MARPNQEAIETFMSITGSDEALALRKLEEHGGDLNAAVNAHFSEGDRSTAHETVAGPQDDLMEIDDPIDVGPTLPLRNPASLLSEATMNPFSLLDSQFRGSLFDSGPNFMDRQPFVSHPREVREIPIEVKDGGDGSNCSGNAPIIEDVTGTEPAHGPDVHGTVIIDDEDDDDIPTLRTTRIGRRSEPENNAVGYGTLESRAAPSAPRFDDLPDYGNDIEEEMIRAAIEASKRDVQERSDSEPQQRQSHAEDAELAEVVSLSLKSAEQEKALREQKVNIEPSQRDSKPADVELEEIIAPEGRLERGGSSIQDEVEDLEEQPLVRHRSRRSMESGKEVGVVEPSPPSSPKQNDTGGKLQRNGDAFPAEWGGISSEEHDEAVMLEAAMFGGIPERTGYRFAYAPHQLMQAESSYPWRAPRPPSPSLQAQRLIREQQDDEYLASLAADREKEMKAVEEAEACRLLEEAAKEAALEAERKKEEELRSKLAEEQEFERQLAAKDASLPDEPASDNENAVTLLVRMPDGSRRGRRFLKSDKLQSLFDFIDIGRAVKPGTYRLVRPYPRRAFGDAESSMTLSELGLTGKQEALYLELV